MKGFYWILILLLLSVGQIESVQAAPASPSGAAPVFPKPVEDYHDEQIAGITAKLVQRIQAEPFNLVGTLIFLGAIIHTFLASKFMLIAHRLEHQYLALKEQERMPPTIKSFLGSGTAYSFGHSYFIFSERLKLFLEFG